CAWARQDGRPGALSTPTPNQHINTFHLPLGVLSSRGLTRLRDHHAIDLSRLLGALLLITAGAYTGSKAGFPPGSHLSAQAERQIFALLPFLSCRGEEKEAKAKIASHLRPFTPLSATGIVLPCQLRGHACGCGLFIRNFLPSMSDTAHAASRIRI
ncbi:hypothetical protein B0J12DRAFT_19270, partial [Macrophomina phaseolina]